MLQNLLRQKIFFKKKNEHFNSSKTAQWPLLPEPRYKLHWHHSTRRNNPLAFRE